MVNILLIMLLQVIQEIDGHHNGQKGPFCDNGTPGGFIGCYHWSGNDSQWMGNFYASEFYLLDGQALGPENFGYTDPKTNTWRPKKKYEASSKTATTALILRSRSLWFTMIRSMTSRLKTRI